MKTPALGGLGFRFPRLLAGRRGAAASILLFIVLVIAFLEDAFIPKSLIPSSTTSSTGLIERLTFSAMKILPARRVREVISYSVAGSDPPVFYIDTPEKKVALTFDISWGDNTQALVLPILRERKQGATFFLSGPWAVRYADVVGAMVQDGHEIASHGWAHVNLSQESKETIRQNILAAHEALKKASGVEPRFFRPPNGDYDDVVVATARECGYETIIWSVDSLDWKNPGVDYMVERVVSLSFPGAIILCHASDSSKQIHQALPGILEGLKKKGYEIVTLGELWKAGTPARDDPRGRPRKEQVD